MSLEVERVPERAPLLALVVSCLLLAIVNYGRGLNLWAGYNFGGALMGLVALRFMWDGRMRMPALPLWFCYVAAMLHFLGGSLGAPDLGPGPLCFADLQPGQWLCADGVNGMYHVHPWWDELVHGSSSTAAAIGLSLAWRRMTIHNGWVISPRMVAGICFCLTAAFGVAYEVYEFFGKTIFFTIDQGGYLNTASDLLSDLSGAGFGVMIALYNDPLNADAPAVSSNPLPWQASLALLASLPMVVSGSLLSLDLLLLGGWLVGENYDRVGQVLLISLILSILLSSVRMVTQSTRDTQITL